MIQLHQAVSKKILESLVTAINPVHLRKRMFLHTFPFLVGILKHSVHKKCTSNFKTFPKLLRIKTLNKTQHLNLQVVHPLKFIRHQPTVHRNIRRRGTEHFTGQSFTTAHDRSLILSSSPWVQKKDVPGTQMGPLVLIGWNFALVLGG